MDRGPKTGPVGFPEAMPPDKRRAYRAVLAYFLAVVAALMWPVYELASGIEPRILGVPFSLAYPVILLLGSFIVLLGLFLWEGRLYGHEEPGEDPGGSDERHEPAGADREPDPPGGKAARSGGTGG